jgi:hypothetical protein
LKKTIIDNEQFTKHLIAKSPNWRYFFEILAKLGLDLEIRAKHGAEFLIEHRSQRSESAMDFYQTAHPKAENTCRILQGNTGFVNLAGGNGHGSGIPFGREWGGIMDGVLALRCEQTPWGDLGPTESGPSGGGWF